MKCSLLKNSAFILSIAIAGCDPVYDVDYQVWNASGSSITILVDHSGVRRDTNIISDDTGLIVLNASSICCTTKEFLGDLNMLPFEISIVNSGGSNYNKDAADISIWRKIYPDKPGGLGTVILTVRPEDFN